MRPQAKLHPVSRTAEARPKGRPPCCNEVRDHGSGAGESVEEVYQTIDDIAEQGTDILTVGQYLQPSPTHVSIARFYRPEEFRKIRTFAEMRGFRHVESGPLVRSSYHAASHVSAG